MRKVVLYGVIAIVIYLIASSPDAVSGIVKTIFEILTGFADGLGSILNDIFN